MRALICEDQEAEAELTIRYIKRFCSQINVAASLASALLICSRQTFDIILLDLRLTDSAWEETLKWIRTLEDLQPDAGIAVISGMPVEDLKHQSIKAGAHSFAPKNELLFRDDGKALRIAMFTAMIHKDSQNRSPTFIEHLHDLEQSVNQRMATDQERNANEQ